MKIRTTSRDKSDRIDHINVPRYSIRFSNYLMSLIIYFYSLESFCLEGHKDINLPTYVFCNTTQRNPWSKGMGKYRNSTNISNELYSIVYIHCFQRNITLDKPFIKCFLGRINITILKQIRSNIRTSDWSFSL
jgi:hypothetical protein